MWWQSFFERRNRRKRHTSLAVQVDFEGILSFQVPVAQPGGPTALQPVDALHVRVLVPSENTARAGNPGPRRLVSV